MLFRGLFLIKKVCLKLKKGFSFSKKIKDSIQLIPVIVLITSVIGSIYVGVATATEAASLGVVGALILSFFQKSLNKETFKLSLLGATKTSCMIAFILAGSSFLALAMGFTGLPRNLAIWINEMNLSPYVLIFVFNYILYNSWNVFGWYFCSRINHGNYRAYDKTSWF